MKRVHCVDFIVCLLLIISLFSCTDKDDQGEATGITGQSWEENIPVEVNVAKVSSVRFNAAASWTASSDADWCTLLTASGEKGASSVTFLVTSASSVERTSAITIRVKGYTPAVVRVKQKAGSGTVSEDVEVNVQVDQYLKEMYLWNDEYKTLTLDYTKPYDSFFNDALYSLTTNTLDKKATSNGYILFSYIEKKDPVKVSRAADKLLVDKEAVYSFGIVGMTPVLFGTQADYQIYFCVQGVYPDSPAARAGIKRGMLISGVDGNELTKNNYHYYYFRLLYPDASFGAILTERDKNLKYVADVTLTSEAMYCNPVLLDKVEEVGGHRIGYLVYSEFDAGFDRELFEVFKEFKSKQVTDVVLDLRYNGGGHTWSANLIATCIAGQASQGKVFTSLRFNEERMKLRGGKREDELFAYAEYPNLKTSLSAGALGLSRVYCLVGKGTASSSELVINSLKGIDVDVVLIGSQTTGKNVGMEYEDLTVNNQLYRVVPITFQSYNAKGFGDYERGFTPDWNIDETNPYGWEDTFYLHRDYGTAEEPLYAKALELITGQTTSGRARSVWQSMEGRILAMPMAFRVGHEGMLRPVSR